MFYFQFGLSKSSAFPMAESKSSKLEFVLEGTDKKTASNTGKRGVQSFNDYNNYDDVRLQIRSFQ